MIASAPQSWAAVAKLLTKDEVWRHQAHARDVAAGSRESSIVFERRYAENRLDPYSANVFKETQGASRTLGIEVQSLEVRGPDRAAIAVALRT